MKSQGKEDAGNWRWNDGEREMGEAVDTVQRDISEGSAESKVKANSGEKEGNVEMK